MPKNNVKELTIRVIGGKFRGRKLDQPSKNITRPTMSKVKEAIFNIIQFDIEGSVCLDLFAGSGSLGIEAISRGAMKSVEIEKSQEAIDILRKNVDKIGINNIDIIKQDAISYINGAVGLKFDFIFIDPPFKKYELYSEVLTTIVKAKLLATTGYLILETDNLSKIEIPDGLIIQKERKYGISTMLMLTNNI